MPTPSRIATSLLLFVALIATVQADRYDPTRVVTAQTKDDFALQYQAVIEAMKPGGKYELVRGHERETVMRRLDEIRALLADYQPGTRLRDTEMTALVTAQEEVNGILTRRDGDRLVCTTAPPTGSHLPASHCKPYRDIELGHRATDKYLRDMTWVRCGTRCGGKP